MYMKVKMLFCKISNEQEIGGTGKKAGGRKMEPK